jgi:hypothetical protein
MRIILLLAVGGAAFALTGCAGTAPATIHPLYTDKDTAFDSGLLGRWVMEEDKATAAASDVIEVKQDGADAYLVTLREEQRQILLSIHLTKIGAATFLDYAPTPGPGKPSPKDQGYLALHGFFRVQRDKDRLQVSLLSDDWFTKQSEGGRLPVVWDTVEEDQRFVTSSTADLRKVMEIALADPKAFIEPTALVRLPPLPAAKAAAKGKGKAAPRARTPRRR